MRKDYESEAALCASFIAWAEPQGWTAYAETAGWDIVLVRNADGRQIGIEAKLKPNLKVLYQANKWRDDYYPNRFCPDHRAVLVGYRDSDCAELCQALGFGFFAPGFDGFGARIDTAKLADFMPRQRCSLPEYVPDVAAGASGPSSLTEWKIGALRICAKLEVNGGVTRLDFKAAGIDYRRWIGSCWMQAESHEVKGATRRYVEIPGKLKFREQHPVVYQTILAEERSRFSPAAHRGEGEGE